MNHLNRHCDSLLWAAPKHTSIKGFKTCRQQTSSDLAPKSSSWCYAAVVFTGSIHVPQKQSPYHNSKTSEQQSATCKSLKTFQPRMREGANACNSLTVQQRRIPAELASKALCVGICWGSDSIWNMRQRFCNSDWIQFPRGGSVTEGQEEHWQERSHRMNYLRWQIWDPAPSRRSSHYQQPSEAWSSFHVC